MQLKVTTYFVLFTCLVSSLMGKTLHRRQCVECEEEEWEEVPCESIPSNVATVTTSSPSILKPTECISKTTINTTPKPKHLTTVLPQTTTFATTTSSESAIPKDPYEKCYCECKLGCKEFCRKVVANPTEKQIVQVTKKSESLKKGRIETTHILEREYIPKGNHKYESKSNKYSTPQRLPASLQSNYEEDHAAYAPYQRGKNYNSEPIVPPIEPIYGPYAVSQTGANNIGLFDSYPTIPQHSLHYSASRSYDSHNFPIPFENVYSKVSKNLLEPVQSVQLPYDASSEKDSSPIAASFSPPAPPLDNYDDSLAAFLREVISHSPTNEASHELYSKPSYSLSYN